MGKWRGGHDDRRDPWPCRRRRTITGGSMSTTATEPEIDGLKARLRETWMAGDYDRFSRYMEQGARIFYEQLDVPAGSQLLDVACGSGQVALWAARDGVHVTGVDIAPNLVQRAQARANAEGLKACFIEGDAEALPFEDASFDVVTSLLGAMFAPRPELVARELLRVCSPGGTIAMGNWTREGFIGQMFKTFAKFIAPSGMPAPVLWGDEAVVRERLGHGVSDLTMTRAANIVSTILFRRLTWSSSFGSIMGLRIARLLRWVNRMRRNCELTWKHCGLRTIGEGT